VVPVPGGVLIRTSDGILVGAVGVSGDTSDKDEECAAHGVHPAGLVADRRGVLSGGRDQRRVTDNQS
jgi:hypothetical protein